MKIKKQYELKENAWIHLGDGKLHKGTVVDIFDLAHAGYDPGIEFYIVAVDTEIEPLLEVRTWEQMSQDAKGPIGSYRGIKQDFATKKFLGKVGIVVPTEQATVKEVIKEVVPADVDDIYDPTPEEVNAAIERAARQQKDMYTKMPLSEKPKRFYGKRKK